MMKFLSFALRDRCESVCLRGGAAGNCKGSVGLCDGALAPAAPSLIEPEIRPDGIVVGRGKRLRGLQQLEEQRLQTGG